MRRLMCLRHAKALRSGRVSDLDRPLDPQGREAARRVGLYLAGEGLRPDLALVSPARRTQETWELVKAALGDVSTAVEPRLYEASADTLLTVVEEAEAGLRGVMLVGHNPGCEELARALVGPGDRDALARLGSGYPPAALAVIDFAIEDWRGVAPRGGRLDRFVTPDTIGAHREG